MNKKQKNIESEEALMRIPVLIVSGIILCAWSYLIGVFLLINFIYTLFSNKRLREMSELSEVWNTQVYTFNKYMTFVDNERPFPFGDLKKNMSKFK